MRFDLVCPGISHGRFDKLSDRFRCLSLSHWWLSLSKPLWYLLMSLPAPVISVFVINHLILFRLEFEECFFQPWLRGFWIVWLTKNKAGKPSGDRGLMP